MPRRRLSLAQARRVALAAQGFGAPRRSLPAEVRPAVTMRDVQAMITRLAQFQIDSINVVERAHYLPLYSRLGAYDKSLLDRALSRPPRRLVEYWGHAASMIDTSLVPALRFRMQLHRDRPWSLYTKALQAYPGLDEKVLAEVAATGPLTARQIEHDEIRDRSQWGWNWSAIKTVLEHLHSTGELVSTGRTTAFERRYDLPERALPATIVTAPTPTVDEQVLTLVRRAASALGIASTNCLADYFRLRQGTTRAAVTTLEASGELVPVEVEGWARPVWLWHQARVPRSLSSRALVSPFDSLVFERRRTHELFGLFYRIEIYVPEARRQHGYYVYPFLLDTDFVARVDLKADRANSTLLVKAAWFEPGHDQTRARVARELAAELGEMARWTGCPTVVVQPRGDLAGQLAQTLTATY